MHLPLELHIILPSENKKGLALTWTMSRDRGPRAVPASFTQGFWGAQASLGAEPASWAWLAVLHGCRTWHGQEEACGCIHWGLELGHDRWFPR